MKVRYILSSVALASLSLTSCSDLDTAPEGNIITSDKKGEILEEMPERGLAGVRAIFQGMSAYEPNYETFGKIERHSDIGYPSLLMFTDANSEDVVSDPNGYNWNGNSLDYSDRTYTSYESQMVWNDHYNAIYVANTVIKGYRRPNKRRGSFLLCSGTCCTCLFLFQPCTALSVHLQGQRD